MAESGPSKTDIETVFQRLRAIPANKVCFDCNAKNPTWSSVTYGVFICLDCSAVHRSLGVHLTFVRSTNLDTNWTWKQLRNMQLGGNASATQFFRTHGLSTEDARQKYSSRVAQMYKDKLNTMAEQAMKMYGTKLHLDPAPVETKEKTETEVDWFSEHTGDADTNFNGNLTTSQVPKPEAISSDAKLWGGGNTVTSPTSGDTPRQSSIGIKKPQVKRSGLGARKGGLGAQKVCANFEDIEREAIMAEKLKVEAKESESKATIENVEQEVASLRLAYKDPNSARANDDRLGIAGANRSNSVGVTHSATSDMTIIEHEDTKNTRTNLDDLESSIMRNEPFRLEDLIMWGESKPSSKLSSSWEKIEPEPSKTVHTMFSPVEDKPISNSSPAKPRYGRKPEPVEDDSAVKKFGSAKAISSAQFFGDQDSRFERDANLSRFQGSTSISSADYFGSDRPMRQQQAGFTVSAPDLDEVRESVRAGVTRVAGRLSSLANGVVSSIQERYGY